METAAAAASSFPSFHCSAGSISHVRSAREVLGQATWPTSQVLALRKLRQARVMVSCAKTAEQSVSSNSGVSLDSKAKSSTGKLGFRNATFPDAFEALVLEVCDETNVAELQLKVGDFEMHLKRNIGGVHAPAPIDSPVQSEPVVQSTSTIPSTSAPKPSSEKPNPFASASSAVSHKLAALEASGVRGFELLTSPTVGVFRRGRTRKGQKLPPLCNQGDVIKEGKVIGYIQQFGSEIPVKANVTGEVLKLLFDDGDAVGYGDPLIAVLPSFHGLN